MTVSSLFSHFCHNGEDKLKKGNKTLRVWLSGKIGPPAKNGPLLNYTWLETGRIEKLHEDNLWSSYIGRLKFQFEHSVSRLNYSFQSYWNLEEDLYQNECSFHNGISLPQLKPLDSGHDLRRTCFNMTSAKLSLHVKTG